MAAEDVVVPSKHLPQWLPVPEGHQVTIKTKIQRTKNFGKVTSLDTLKEIEVGI